MDHSPNQWYLHESTIQSSYLCALIEVIIQRKLLLPHLALRLESCVLGMSRNTNFWLCISCFDGIPALSMSCQTLPVIAGGIPKALELQQGPELHDGHLQGLGIGCASAAMPSFQIAAGQPIFPIPDPMPFVAGLLLCHPFAV